MSIVLVAGIWLSLGVIFCLVAGRGIALADEASTREPSETPAVPPRTFATRPVHEWALAAADVATDELLATRPGAIRRVAAK